MTITTSIYCWSDLYSGGPSVINDLKSSGFTTVIAWALHVDTTGDLIFNDSPVLVSNGSYTDQAAWPEQLADLKQGQTSVNRLLFSIGGWDVSDFANIQQLINTQGSGPDSVLYQNFKALKTAIPTIDGIDFDIENTYDPSTTVAFAQMLGSLGYTITFCPYENPGFWTGCLSALNVNNPGLVTGFNLQCYAGGAINTPEQWIEYITAKMGTAFPAASLVYPGLWCYPGDPTSSGGAGCCPDAVTDEFADWKSSGIQGGFIWRYDDIQQQLGKGGCAGAMDTAAYARAIVRGLEGTLQSES
jgi:hypothetical protein